ncbi:hypothetical protein N9M53_06330 [Alphaproteobacteria bacterium]|jgi:hypothetical protein|nr:hypothetical protein [Alphaproteobacteria bacterium]MDG2465607.1 hypothetical protein [Alphaproteobacteria bacterium]
MRENILAVLILLGLISGVYFLAPVIYDQFGYDDPDEIVTVTVELENKCLFDDDVFVVKTLNTSRTFRFSNGKAIIRVPRKTQIMLAVSREYPEFSYSDVPQKIDDKMPMKMIADCTTSPRLKSTMDALQQQFNN